MLSETIVISTHAVVIVFTQFWVFTNYGNFISNLYEYINHIDLIFSRLNYIYINIYLLYSCCVYCDRGSDKAHIWFMLHFIVSLLIHSASVYWTLEFNASGFVFTLLHYHHTAHIT